MTNENTVTELYKRTRRNIDHFSITVNSVSVDGDPVNKFLYKGNRTLWYGDFNLYVPFTLVKLIINTNHEYKRV